MKINVKNLENPESYYWISKLYFEETKIVIFNMTTNTRLFTLILFILFCLNNEYFEFVSVECMISRPTLFLSYIS